MALKRCEKTYYGNDYCDSNDHYYYSDDHRDGGNDHHYDDDVDRHAKRVPVKEMMMTVMTKMTMTVTLPVKEDG